MLLISNGAHAMGQNNHGAAPNSPVVVSAEKTTAAASHSVKLKWNASVAATQLPRDVIIGYNVYRSKTPHVASTPENRIGSSVSPATSYVDAHVESGKTYYYVTTAVTKGRESDRSNEVKVLVP